MGCVQAKSSTDSPPRGLNKLKMENGYVGKGGGFMGSRRSTGHSNNSSRDSGRLFRNESRNYNPLYVSGGSDGKVVISREGEKDGGNGGSGGGGNVSQRISTSKQDKGDEVVDGWPKWLTDNIPREALAGLVPKSADSYDKLAKVRPIEFFVIKFIEFV